MSGTAARDLVAGLCPNDTGPRVDLKALRQSMKVSSEQEADREHVLLEQVKAHLQLSINNDKLSALHPEPQTLNLTLNPNPKP